MSNAQHNANNGAETMTLPAARQEQLEMAGYCWAEKSKVCYRNGAWTDAEAAAFKKGFDDAKKVFAQIGRY